MHFQIKGNNIKWLFLLIEVCAENPNMSSVLALTSLSTDYLLEVGLVLLKLIGNQKKNCSKSDDRRQSLDELVQPAARP
jgi:hypothetical protein